MFQCEFDIDSISQILPGITADSQRVKSKTWATWERALERRKWAKAMRKEWDQKLLGERTQIAFPSAGLTGDPAEVFRLWKEAAAHKSMLNAR